MERSCGEGTAASRYASKHEIQFYWDECMYTRFALHSLQVNKILLIFDETFMTELLIGIKVDVVVQLFIK